MNLAELLMSSQDNLAQLKQLIKAEGVTIGGDSYKPARVPNPTTLKSKLDKASDDELQTIVDTLGIDIPSGDTDAVDTNSDDVSNIPDDVLADEVTDTVTTKEGNDVPVIMGAFIGRSQNSGNVQLQLKCGLIATVQPTDAVLNALDQNVFVKGEHTFPLRRDNIRYSKHEGYVYAQPNYSHPTMRDAVNRKNNNQQKIEDYARQLRSKGMNPQQVNKLVQDQIVKSVEFPTLD